MIEMVSELFTVHGETDAASVTDTFTLYSDSFLTTPATPEPLYLRIPAGMKLKIWSRRLSGDAQSTTLLVEYTHDVTAALPTWLEMSIDLQDIAVESRLDEEKRRPIVFQGFTGTEAVSFVWEQTVAATAYFEAEVEYTDE